LSNGPLRAWSKASSRLVFHDVYAYVSCEGYASTLRGHGFSRESRWHRGYLYHPSLANIFICRGGMIFFWKCKVKQTLLRKARPRSASRKRGRALPARYRKEVRRPKWSVSLSETTEQWRGFVRMHLHSKCERGGGAPIR